jgi:predicted branched-subunit amino acid permease
MLPILVAYVPLALMVGTAAAASANPLAAWLSTWTIYGGAAQLATLDVLGHGSGWAAAAVAGLLVNARLSAYATAMAPEWRSAPLRQRTLAALLLTEAPWALTRGVAAGKRQFYLGAALTLWVAWPTLVSIGTLTGAWVAHAPVAGLLPALTLGAIVVRQAKERPNAVVVAAAALAAVLTVSWSTGAAFAVAAVAGSAIGMLAERAR